MGDANGNEHVCTNHSGLVKSIENIETSMSKMAGSIEDLFEKFNGEIVKYAQRPTWLICSVVSTMSGIIGILITFILYAHFGK